MFRNIIKFILIFSLISISLSAINLTDYKYPINKKSTQEMIIPILGTNDFHGGIFPNKYADSKNIRYSNGGAINLYSYVKVLKDEWETNFYGLMEGTSFKELLNAC